MATISDAAATTGGAATLAVPPARPQQKASRRRVTVLAFAFMLPALVVLGALVVYPIVYTVIRSTYNASGQDFVGFHNYVAMFTDSATFTAIRNNVIWVIVAPAVCTALGLVFAVLMERIRWSTVFKVIVFMPMAISMLAAGVIFRTMFQESPQLGVVNAAITAVHSVFSHQSALPGARPRDGAGIEAANDAVVTSAGVSPGSTVGFPLIAIKAADVPPSSEQAQVAPTPAADAISGTVWLDVVQGGGGTQGQIDQGKKGLPGLRVEAVDPAGKVVAAATTDTAGRFTISGLDPGASYHVTLPASNFGQGFQGVSWLGSSFITAVIICAYVWIWAGFAMVMIASGLSAIDRSVLEAARVDGANEWQVFRRVTAPMLAPVLTVVFITLVVNVLKIFDLVYVIPPGESKPAANVIAVQMWTVSFGGGSDQGLGSALAVLLLVLVLPVMISNVRRFRQGGR
ncbi:MAG TPA: ABC transporter permease subunit [Cellulomonas sp.]